MNYEIFNIPFPSVILCPGTRVDWNEVTDVANTLIPADNKEARDVFFELMTNMSKLRLSHFNQLNMHIDDSAPELLNGKKYFIILLIVARHVMHIISDTAAGRRGIVRDVIVKELINNKVEQNLIFSVSTTLVTT